MKLPCGNWMSLSLCDFVQLKSHGMIKASWDFQRDWSDDDPAAAAAWVEEAMPTVVEVRVMTGDFQARNRRGCQDQSRQRDCCLTSSSTFAVSAWERLAVASGPSTQEMPEHNCWRLQIYLRMGWWLLMALDCPLFFGIVSVLRRRTSCWATAYQNQIPVNSHEYRISSNYYFFHAQNTETEPSPIHWEVNITRYQSAVYSKCLFNLASENQEFTTMILEPL